MGLVDDENDCRELRLVTEVKKKKMSSSSSDIPILPPGVFNNTLGLLYVGFVVSSM